MVVADPPLYLNEHWLGEGVKDRKTNWVIWLAGSRGADTACAYVEVEGQLEHSAIMEMFFIYSVQYFIHCLHVEIVYFYCG